MKPWHLLAAALVALVVGGGGGYFFGVENASTPSRPGPMDNERVADAPDPDPQPDGAKSDPAPVAPADKPQPAPAPVVPGDANALVAWLASLAGEKPSAGTGRIWGRVTLKDGSPLADVEITAIPVHAPEPVRRDEEPSLEVEIERYARGRVFRHAGKHTATTGADGGFEFTGLGDYDYWLSAKAKGFQFEQTGRGRRNGNVRPDAEVNFLARPVAELDLDVRLPDGTQPKSAQPNVQTGSISRGGYWRPEQTVSTYEPGKGTLTVKAGDYEEFQSDPVEVELVEQQTLKLTVNLKAVAGILCKLKVPPEFGPETRPQVTLQPDPPAEAPATVPRVRDMRSNWRNEDEIAFVNLKAGTYRLIASLGAQVLAWQDVQLGDEFKTVELAIPEPDKGDFIIVRVNGPDGKPAPRTRLNVNVRSENRGGGGNTRTIEKPDGTFWVTRATPDERRFPEGTPWWYEITANCEAFGVTTARYESGATGELVMQFAVPASLTITIPGAATHPLKARLRPSLMRSEGENRGWNGVNPGGRQGRNGLESDTLKYSPISPGKYRFTLNLARSDEEEWYGGNTQVVEINFEVTSGENSQSCLIPVLCKLTLVIADPKTVQHITVRPASGKGETRNAWSDNVKERTVFEALAAGDWIVATNEGEMTVTLSGDREVTLSVRKFDCLLLSGIKAGGKIEALGLREGDKLIRIDGTEVEGTDGAQMSMMTSLGKESTTWTVQRAGRSVDITFNGKDLMKIMTDRTEGTRENFYPRPATRD